VTSAECDGKGGQHRGSEAPARRRREASTLTYLPCPQPLSRRYIEHRRPPGRPRNQWLDQLRDDSSRLIGRLVSSVQQTSTSTSGPSSSTLQVPVLNKQEPVPVVEVLVLYAPMLSKQLPVPVVQVSVLQAPVLNKQVTVPVVEVLVRYAPVLKKQVPNMSGPSTSKLQAQYIRFTRNHKYKYQ